MERLFARRHSRIVLATVLTITLSACHKNETRVQPAPTTTTTPAPRPMHPAKTRPAPVKPAAVPKTAMAPAPIPMVASDKNMLAAPTGIAECDDYLGNYKACHTVLGTQFTDIEGQLTTLRSSILDTARDQGMDAAKTKCVGLVQQRDEALHGRSCK